MQALHATRALGILGIAAVRGGMELTLSFRCLICPSSSALLDCGDRDVDGMVASEGRVGASGFGSGGATLPWESMPRMLRCAWGWHGILGVRPSPCFGVSCVT